VLGQQIRVLEFLRKALKGLIRRKLIGLVVIDVETFVKTELFVRSVLAIKIKEIMDVVLLYTVVGVLRK